MKIQLETIPVWDGVNSGSECYICDLMKAAEEHALSYYLGSAVMVPEIRVEMNKKGFCPDHFMALAEMKKAQPLGLLCDTFYEESKGLFKPHFERIEKAGNLKKALKEAEAFNECAEERGKGCLVCSMMDERESRYLYTTAALYGEDPAFAKALGEGKGFCIHHTALLSKVAVEALSKDKALEFIKLLYALLDRNLDRVQHDDWYLTQKYKSENRDKPWNGCEDASSRAVYKLTGRSRVRVKK
jgi:hypothetical protein